MAESTPKKPVPKHEPIRTCIGCNVKRHKRMLLRIVRSQDRGVDVDVEQKAPGRGAYLCYQSSCLGKAKKKRSLEHSLKARIADDIYEQVSRIVDGD